MQTVPITEEDISETTSEVLHVTRSTLNSSHIKHLATQKCSVLHVKSFVDEQTCQHITSGVDDLGYKSYTNVPHVKRIGMSFYETESKDEMLNLYFQSSTKSMEDLRSACSPVMSPLDTLRCKLDEIWNPGANLQTLNGKKMFVGLSRVVEPGTEFLAHHDIFQQDAPNEPDAISVKSQFAANIYIQTPNKGGELLMWNVNMEPKIFDELRKDDGLKVDTLSEPDITVKPEAGDLLIFDSRKLHAVAPPIDKPRLALSFFIAYRGDNAPLTFWS